MWTYKECANNELVVRRKLFLYADRFETFHDYERDRADKKVGEPFTRLNIRSAFRTECITLLERATPDKQQLRRKPAFAECISCGYPGAVSFFGCSC